MISIENKKRLIFGLIFISILWFATLYSVASCSILFSIIGLICIYEMYQLRIGKTKLIPLVYIITPFILIQILIWKYLSINIYDNIVWMPEVILYLFALTWTFDTFAYIFGVKFGKHKILPSISPKKSWEGFIGGLIFTTILAIFIFGENINKILMYSVLIPISATLGDFIESYYKRKAMAKDSGNLIPGHGGMLDRMDSLLISISVISLIIIIGT
tara:strand:- start:644 stop:1291 length:648 start_codon:yes stop_codon:yes gene_type:complete